MKPGRVSMLAAVFALGFSSVITQLALMREMLGVFAGNELVLGVALGNWLLWMGVGASLGRRAPRGAILVLPPLLVLTAVVPPGQILVLRALRQVAFRPGEAISVLPTVWVSGLVLLPYCLVAGFGLAVACLTLPDRGPASAAGRVYAWDSLGSVAGGLAFSFVLVSWLDHLALLVVPALGNLLAAGGLVWTFGRDRPAIGVPALAALAVVGGVLAGWAYGKDPDSTSTARQFAGQRLLFKGHSPYGRLVVTEANGQTNVIENGAVLVSTPNIEQAEETAHFAMVQRPAARTVLLVGGALSGAAREILRYGVATLDCVELDPLVARVGSRFLPGAWSDPRVRLHEMDARQFLRRGGNEYDVIILALPDPTTAQINRLFTHECFREIRARLRSDGVLCFGMDQYANFAGPELSRILRCARETAARSFRNVLLLPAGRVYYLASNGPLTEDVGVALERQGLVTQWVTRHYTAAVLSADRLNAIQEAAGGSSLVNRDFAPVLYYLHLRHWASQFDSVPHWLLALAALGLVGYLVRLRPPTGAIFASGFAAAALEVVLLLAMQTLAGSVYREVAWVVTSFMAGLALGAWQATRHLEGRLRSAGLPHLPAADRASVHLSALAVGVAGCAALVAVAVPALAKLSAGAGSGAVARVGVLVLALGLAGVVGAQFPLAIAAASSGQSATRVYAADFVGASLGALLTSAWLLPLVGATSVCGIAVGLNLTAALWLTRRRTLA